MKDKLLISGIIESGWTSIKFQCGDDNLEIRTSYIFDGLTNFLTAISLLNKGLCETETTLIDEPTEHILHFKKSGESDNLTITFFKFENYNGIPLRDRIIKEHKSNFEIFTDLKRLTIQVFNLFEYFKNSYGLDGYEEKWRHKFPADKLKELKNNWR